MFRFTIVFILSLLLNFYCKITEAQYTGSYYQIDLKHNNDLTTTTIYIYVETSIVLGLYSSPLAVTSSANAVVSNGTYQNNDNIFVYPTISEFYGISSTGISFTTAGILTNLYFIPISDPNPVATLALRDDNGLNVRVTATVTIIPIQFYTLKTSITPTIYISVVFQRCIGVYSSSDVTPTGAVHQPKQYNILLPLHGYTNDNFFNYTMGPPSYGLTYNGISYTYYGLYTNYFYNAGSPTIDVVTASGLRDGPVKLTVIPFITEYYMLTIVTSAVSRTLYLSVIEAVVTGAYQSRADIRASTNNALLPVGAYGNNDNLFNYTAGAPFYGLTYGIGILIDGAKARVHAVRIVSPGLFLSFDDAGSTYHTPATVTAMPFSLTGNGNNGFGSSSSGSPSPLAALAVLVVVPIIIVVLGLLWYCTRSKGVDSTGGESKGEGEGGRGDEEMTDKGPWIPTEST